MLERVSDLLQLHAQAQQAGVRQFCVFVQNPCADNLITIFRQKNTQTLIVFPLSVNEIIDHRHCHQKSSDSVDWLLWFTNY